MALFGAGSLGHALFFHEGFRDDGFFFTHLFDIDNKKVGQKWKDVEIASLDDAEAVLIQHPIDIGVIATPEAAAQDVVNLLTGLGVTAILNFAPIQISVPEGVMLRNVNLAVALESLSFFLSN